MSIRSPIIQPLQLDQFDVIRDLIEQHRRVEYQKILNWFIVGFVCAILLLLWIVISNASLSTTLIFFVFLLCIVIPGFFTWQLDQAYRTFFTSVLVPEFIKCFNLQTDVELQYSLLGGISQSAFASCGLFQQPTEYNTSGYINGKIGKTTFQCAHVLAEEVREYGIGYNRHRTTSIFNGLFFIADANKTFQGTTFVVPDDFENAFGHTAHSWQELFARQRFGRCELVSLEDPEFERNFAAYSSDQVEARYLLTPLLMQQISAIRHSWKSPVHIAFIYGKVFLGLETPQNWSAPPSVFRSISADVIQSAHQKVLLMLSLVDDLGLNTRIWGRN